MFAHPDRFRFHTAPPRASRLLLTCFVFLVLLVALSVGILVTAIAQAAEAEPTQDVSPQDATRGTLLFGASLLAVTSPRPCYIPTCT